MFEARFCPRCATELVDAVPELDSRSRRLCRKCGFIAYLNPKVAAGTVPVRDGKVALIRRGVEPARGAWSWPCGYVEIDETVEEAAARETREESGLSVRLGPMLGAWSYPVRGGERPSQTTGLLVMSWISDDVEGSLLAGDDADEARWFPFDEIPWPDLAFDSTRRALKETFRRLGLVLPEDA
ncbi:MAG: NADH pyrophosphatase [Planctomycetes bacterium]|nr:NADH pyrophosphatase [Planctomycetota bacterium]